MRVLLCGAKDIEIIQLAFKKLMNAMSFEFLNYIDGTLGATNSKDWANNSKEAVEKAHLIVFVLIQEAGDITWNTEYITAVNNGKPYILLCEKQLAQHYANITNEKGIKVTKKHKFYKAVNILDLLMSQQRNIVPFDIRDGDFAEVLARQLNYELERAAIQLQIHNRNRTVLEKIRSRNYKSLITENISEKEVDFFKTLLFDPFEHKEVRKRILYYFTIYKSLTDEQIVELFDDPEQGISRAVVEQVASLLHENSDKDYVLKHLVSFVKGSNETGTIRRAISSIFEIDIPKGLYYMFEMFPAYDIGTPRRVLSWLIDNIEQIKPYSKDIEFLSRLGQLVDLCKTFSPKGESLEMLGNRFIELLGDKNNEEDETKDEDGGDDEHDDEGQVA